MSKEVAGVALSRFKYPIWDALHTFEEQAGLTDFFSPAAVELELKPSKPYSARSQTPVNFLGEHLADLFVIAFKPGDGTGDESTFKVGEYVVAFPYPPREPKVVPRSKKGTHSEIWLPLASAMIDQPNIEVLGMAGDMDVLGINRRRKAIEKIGSLNSHNHLGLSGIVRPQYTVGYRPNHRRFGDPHAIFSSVEDRVQVCGFLALNEAAYQQHGNEMLRVFNPRLPTETK